VSSPPADEYDLTPRQIEVLNLIGRGLSNRDISEVLGISVNTVKVHVQALMSALNVSNRTEAVFIYDRLRSSPASETADALSLAGSRGRPAIAVLPFELSGPEDLEHFSRALTEELITRIGEWKWFPVIGYTAITSALASGGSAVEAAAALDAHYCVSGRIQQAGDSFRVAVSLSHVPDGAVVWSDRFDGSTSDLFGFLDDTVRQIVGQMAPELLRQDSEHAGARSFPAWNEASRAMWHIYVGSREHSAIAAKAWERAIELDPNLVFGWYAKAAGLYQRVFDQWSADPAADMAAFVAAAERCVALDITDSAAQEICGFARLVSGRLEDAIVHLRRAVTLNPSNAQAFSELGQAYTFSGRHEEAIAAFEEALAINPQGDSTWSVMAGIALAYFLKGDCDEAVDNQRRAVAINPNIVTPLVFLASYLAAAGDLEQAQQLKRVVLEKDPGFRVGRVERSLAMVSEPLRQRFAAAARAAGFE